jgi:hypothetical protein
VKEQRIWLAGFGGSWGSSTGFLLYWREKGAGLEIQRRHDWFVYSLALLSHFSKWLVDNTPSTVLYRPMRP